MIRIEDLVITNAASSLVKFEMLFRLDSSKAPRVFGSCVAPRSTKTSLRQLKSIDSRIIGYAAQDSF